MRGCAAGVGHLGHTPYLSVSMGASAPPCMASGSILMVASRVAVFKDDERGSRSIMLCLNSLGSLRTMFAKILDCQEWSEMVILWK